MHTLACSPKLKLGPESLTLTGDFKRNQLQSGRGKCSWEKWSCWRWKGGGAVSSASSLTIKAKEGIYAAPFL